MTLTAKGKLLGTLPTSRGNRILAPGSLPHGITANTPLRELLHEYREQVEGYRKDEATVARLSRSIEEAREQYPQRVYEANVKGQAKPKDPVPALTKKLEAAQRQLDVSEYAVVQTSDRLQDMRDDPDLLAHATKRWEAKLAQIIEMATTIDWEMDDLGEARYLLTWLKSHKPTKKIEGRAEVAALRRQLAKYEDTEPPRRVSPLAMQALQRGEDVEDIDGKPLTFAVAEDLHKRGKLKVNFGKPLPRGAGMA